LHQEKGICHQKYLRQEDLYDQFNTLIKKVSLSDDWAEKMIKQLGKDKNKLN